MCELAATHLLFVPGAWPGMQAAQEPAFCMQRSTRAAFDVPYVHT